MKKLQYLFAAAGLLAMASCSSDDDDNSLNNDLTGTYELTSAVAAQAQDYDGDGDSSTNLVTEGTCYTDSWISFHDNGTYDEVYSFSTTAANGLSVECNEAVSSGTYVATGTTVTTTRTSGSGVATATYTFDASNRKLTRTAAASLLTAFNTTTALWTSMTGNLELTFEKYTNNANDNGAGIDDTDNVSTTGQISGTFGLTGLFTVASQDLDDDGDSSTNLVSETNCYTDSNIVFSNNGTYTEAAFFTNVNATGSALTCESQNITGTYTRTGNMIFLRRPSGDTTFTTEYSFDATNNTLMRSDVSGNYPSFNAATNLYTMQAGTLEYKYVKE
ncbi:hypothetical protein [Flavobacterium sp.]|uniref:hypothetical protein n=1 Tax=Flavobacterium sp. TaxID=239 RepID=UPI0026047406|nr:hypothetical protein [Flavobacterium sp.]